MRKVFSRYVTLVFNRGDHFADHPAGFAIRCCPDSTLDWTWLGNRLAIDGDYNDPKVVKNGKFFSFDLAPLRRFWWIDLPDGPAGTFWYATSRVSPRTDRKRPAMTSEST
jgi:hypothetical protein